MMLKFALIFAVFGSAYCQYEGIALGGYGATNFFELTTATAICKDDDITPPMPGTLPASNPTWVSEWVDDSIYLCGGQVRLLSFICCKLIKMFQNLNLISFKIY